MRSSARCTSSIRSAGPGEDHAVLADHGAAAQAGKADVAGLARAGLAIAAARRMRREIDAAAFRRRAAEHQRGAGRRVDLLVVMHLEDLDVEAVIERLRHALGQRRQQIDAEAHVAGLHDHGALGGFPDLRLFVGRMPGGADDMHLAGGQRGKRRARLRNGEIDDAVGLGEQRLGVGGELDAVGGQPRQHAGVLADAAASPSPSSAPASTSPLVSAMALTSVRPMRPPAPATISRMSAMDQLLQMPRGYSGTAPMGKRHIAGGAAPRTPAFAIDLATRPDLIAVSVNALT